MSRLIDRQTAPHRRLNSAPNEPRSNILGRPVTEKAGPFWYIKDDKVVSDQTPGNAGIEHYIIQPWDYRARTILFLRRLNPRFGYTMGTTGLVPALVVDRSAPFAAGALRSNVSMILSRLS
jgi:hypothetical protein